MKTISRMGWLKIGTLEIGALILLAGVFALSPSLEAKDPAYPVKSITLLNPWVAGGAHELYARALAPHLSKKFGVPVEVVCKPGGAGTVATLEVMRSRPDGYTLLVDCPGSSSLQKALGSELPYKIEERTYMARGIVLPSVIFVPASRPWKTLKDLEDAIRKDPADFKWASCGGTGHSDLIMHLLKEGMISHGVDLSQTKMVPYVSAVPAYTAIAGGHVDIYAGTRTGLKAFADAGKIRFLAATSKERTQVFPGLPTAVEQGFPKLVTYFWVGFSGPPGLPKAVAEKWIETLKVMVNDPANAPIYDRLGGEAAFLAGDDFKKYVFEEADAVSKMALTK